MTRKATTLSFVLVLMIFSAKTSLIAKSKPEPKPNQFTVPFHYIAKLIMIEVTVNGKQGLLILDTGSPNLVLNAAHFYRKRRGKVINGLNGNISQTQSAVISFSLGQISIENKLVNLVDLRHLEQNRNIKILGISGKNILKEYEIMIQYATKELTFFKLDKKGSRLSRNPYYSEPTHIIPFRMKGHLPCIEVSVGKKSFNIALDTGAGINLLDSKYMEQLTASCSDIRQVKVKGLSKKVVKANTALLNSIQLRDISYPPMRTLFKSMNRLNNNLRGKKIDGLFGSEFLRHYRISFNYRKKELLIWEEENAEDLFTKSGK